MKQSLVNSFYRVLQVRRRSVTALNNPLEAYTGNCAGRRENRTFPKQFSLVKQLKQVAIAWVSQKPEQRSCYRQDFGRPVGVIKRGMYRELSCELGRPLCSCDTGRY